MNRLFDWEWEMAVSFALLEASMRDVPPGSKVMASVNRVQARAREIYAENKKRPPTQPKAGEP